MIRAQEFAATLRRYDFRVYAALFFAFLVGCAVVESCHVILMLRQKMRSAALSDIVVTKTIILLLFSMSFFRRRFLHASRCLSFSFHFFAAHDRRQRCHFFATPIIFILPFTPLSLRHFSHFLLYFLLSYFRHCFSQP